MIEIIPNYHPIFVHFSVALLSIGVLFYVLTLLAGISRWRFQWVVVARWNLWLGAAFAVVTAVFGWLAFGSVEHDEAAHAAMVTHRNWALATVSVFAVLALWSLWQHRTDRDLNWGYVALLLLALGLLASTAWHGAELVYRHGLGVLSQPPAPLGNGLEANGHVH